MKLKPINAVFTAVLLIAPAVFAQEQSQSGTAAGQDQQSSQATSPEQQNQGATGQTGQTGTEQQGQGSMQMGGQAGTEQQGQGSMQMGGQTGTEQQGQGGTGMAGPQGQSAGGAQGTAAIQANVISGTVTSYTPNQCITVKQSNGQTREVTLGANSRVSQNVRIGSRVKVIEGTVNGQPMVRVVPAPSGAARGTSGAQGAALPRTASDYPLVGLFGLLSMAAAACIRFANRRLA